MIRGHVLSNEHPRAPGNERTGSRDRLPSLPRGNAIRRVVWHQSRGLPFLSGIHDTRMRISPSRRNAPQTVPRPKSVEWAFGCIAATPCLSMHGLRLANGHAPFCWPGSCRHRFVPPLQTRVARLRRTAPNQACSRPPLKYQATKPPMRFDKVPSQSRHLIGMAS